MDLFEKFCNLEKSAEAFGFKWEKVEQIIAQVKSECVEIETQLLAMETIDANRNLQEEIGDLIHAVFSLCLFCQFDPKETFAKSIIKFQKRFEKVKRIAQLQGYDNLAGQNFESLMQIWEQAKKESH
ncbi:MAG: nucleoside triphosphate hydrolase [Gammaproteobacteria bacterium]|nr:nucleoside triphosphate hydrolase [Gammaproteobacteria bacterium]